MMNDGSPLFRDVPYRELAEALWTWLRAAVPFWVRNACHTSTCEDFFRKTTADEFERVCRDRAIYKIGAIERAALLPEYRLIVRAMERSEELRPFVGRWVGGGQHLIHIHPMRFISYVVPIDVDYDSPKDLSMPDLRRITRFLETLRSVLSQDEFETIFVTPLWGLELDSPLQLEPGLVIDELNDYEVERALQMHVISGDILSRRQFKRVKHRRLALKRVVRLPRRVLPARPSPAAFLDVTPERHGFDDPDRLLNLLPLVSTGYAWVGATMTWTSVGAPWGIQSAGFTGSSALGLDDSPFRRPPVNLDQSMTSQLAEYWLAETLTADPALDLAIRRLRLSTERRLPVDRLVDLTIATEALFLGDNEYREELRFRLATRAAYFLENDIEARRRVYKKMTTAYDMRSDIVHGVAQRSTKKSGLELPMADFVDEIEELVRKSVRKRLNTDAKPDWDALIMGPLRDG